jgi:NAD(P)-dependent dehydrogenase (short-subunit alcohol dehydrogenase family)
VIPGAVLKPNDYDQEQWDTLNRKNSPLQRPGTAEDVARAVAYLCSEDYLTGVVFHIDGGEHVM